MVPALLEGCTSVKIFFILHYNLSRNFQEGLGFLRKYEVDFYMGYCEIGTGLIILLGVEVAIWDEKRKGISVVQEYIDALIENFLSK